MGSANELATPDDARKRRRSFVAVPLTLAESPLAAQPPSARIEDDLPVLTEVIPPEAATSGISAPPVIDETLLALLARDIAHAIDQQMLIELPSLIEATLQNAKDELRAGIDATIRIAVRDYLASRQQLRLPLGDPESID